MAAGYNARKVVSVLILFNILKIGGESRRVLAAF